MHPAETPTSLIQEPLQVAGKYFRSGEEAFFVKAVTFGPFPAGTFPDEGIGQLDRIQKELGANAIRLYEIPSLSFMHACAARGLRVFLTLPWSQHVDFVQNKKAFREAEQKLEETVAKFRGHPALGAYLVANEVESTLVRWMGRKRVLHLLESLIDLGRSVDPDALFAYANYPSTEYLLPQNQDFVAMNLYLEDREALSSYLDRLQNLAGNKPLLITEFGIDTRQHTEAFQEETLAWHIETAAQAGCAGTTLFAWSDLWQRGGETIEGWDFGLNDRSGRAKPALTTVKQAWEHLARPGQELRLSRHPFISVIVCTYKGSATLVECLRSITALSYPQLEILLVNDGSDARVDEIAGSFPKVQRISIPHSGLGAARNLGASRATGEILVYTDDDCIVEPDWLTWIASRFLEDESLGCVGGPNIPPPPRDEIHALIAAAPGGPVHVLLDDTHAEHLPGCNLAIRRSVFQEIGGFDPVFRTAGDDVDLCWRVLDAGHRLGFHAAAFVWHYRRFSLKAYFKQQYGYGRAEALLLPKHPSRFRGTGGAIWKGHVYTPQSPADAVVYHGIRGYEPFQLIYPSPVSGWGDFFLHVVWWLWTVIVSIVSVWFPWLSWMALAMLAAPVRTAWIRAGRTSLPAGYESVSLRLRLVVLILVQGVLRSYARLRHGWRHTRKGASLWWFSQSAVTELFSGWWKLGADLAFWSLDGAGRDDFLTAVLQRFSKAREDTTGKTDVILKQGWFWKKALISATEYHENQGRLTRVRLLATPRMITRILALLLAAASGWILWYGDQDWKQGLAWVTAAAALAWLASKLVLFAQKRRMVRIARTVGMEPCRRSR